MQNANQKDTSFFKKVYSIVSQIPYGRVTTYGLIAQKIGSPQAARMVGWAMNASHTQTPEIPAHRVVNRQGLLTGKAHFATPTLMQKRLEEEGITIKNNQIVHFEKHLWNPNNPSKKNEITTPTRH